MCTLHIGGTSLADSEGVQTLPDGAAKREKIRVNSYDMRGSGLDAKRIKLIANVPPKYFSCSVPAGQAPR